MTFLAIAPIDIGDYYFSRLIQDAYWYQQLYLTKEAYLEETYIEI
jgi:hypothetical protein